MQNIQMRIRLGNAYDGEDGVFRNATFAEAIATLQTRDVIGLSGTSVHVIGAYINEWTETVRSYKGSREITRKADEPVFGLEITVYPHRPGWGQDATKPAEVNWSALGSSDTETALFYAQLLTTAANLAAAANASLVAAA